MTLVAFSLLLSSQVSHGFTAFSPLLSTQSGCRRALPALYHRQFTWHRIPTCLQGRRGRVAQQLLYISRHCLLSSQALYVPPLKRSQRACRGGVDLWRNSYSLAGTGMLRRGSSGGGGSGGGGSSNHRHSQQSMMDGKVEVGRALLDGEAGSVPGCFVQLKN